MKKYQIIWASKDGKSNEIIGSAATKAPNDITIIARDCKYKDKYIFYPHITIKAISVLIKFYLLIKALNKCEKDSTILIQYPCFNEKLFQYAKFLFPKRNYITIIHDLNSIRLNGEISKTEVKALSIFNTIIVHSPEMKDYLSRYLSPKVNYHILGCFPYLTNSINQIPESIDEVCFAGNIDKSTFLKEFIPHVQQIKLKLYGKMEQKLTLNSNVKYCGMFNPNNISSLCGSWGLVWDGNSIETCSGTWGEYLKIIAPHKFSLYIAAGIPVIVWEKSAMARLVKEYNIGLTISNLNELNQKLLSVNKKEINSNISQFQKLYIKGDILKSFLQC